MCYACYMSYIVRVAPWLLTVAATAFALTSYLQRQEARRELGNWHKTIGSTVEAGESRAEEIRRAAEADADRLRAEALAAADAKLAAAKAIAAQTEQGFYTKMREKRLHEIDRNLKPLTGGEVFATTPEGGLHPFVDKVVWEGSEAAASGFYYTNRTSRAVQPRVTLELLDDAGAVIASMSDEWSFLEIHPGRTAYERVWLERLRSGTPVYYRIDIGDNWP